VKKEEEEEEEIHIEVDLLFNRGDKSSSTKDVGG